MNWLKENWFKTSIILIGLLITISLLYIASNSNNVSNTSEQNKSNPLDISSDSVKRFYLKSVANVRECAGLDCKIIGQYPQNTSFDLAYDKVDNFPEWVLISWAKPNNPYDSSGSGYINKILFSDTPIVVNANQKQQQNYSTSQKQNNTTSDINNTSKVFDYWSKSVALVNCVNQNISNFLSGGSGTLFKNMYGEYVVLTNQHVVDGADLCFVLFLLDPTGTSGFGNSVTFQGVFSGKLSTDQDDDEYLLKPRVVEQKLRTTSWATYPLSLDFIEKNAIINSVCERNMAKIGDDVAILGYPSIGSQYGLTLTSGKISGYEGNYYVTDAKIDHGNSGGAAILVRNNCYLGIPTFGVVGKVESLGRILDMSRFGY